MALPHVSPQELKHANAYAEELTIEFLIDRWKIGRPELFDHVEIVKRPAETGRDFYVPPALVGYATVVESTRFVGEEPCQLASCFPYKLDLEPCTETDPPRWLSAGEGFVVACQHACRWSDVDTLYRDERCYVSNPLKKMFAVGPESYMGMKTRHSLHSGLNLDRDGDLELNHHYCKSFGLPFVDGDCELSTWRWFAETVLGSTVYRTAYVANTAVYKKPVPPPVPPHLQRKPRIKRSIAPVALVPPKVQTGDPLFDDETTALDKAMEIIADVQVELGVDASLHFVSQVLKRRVPKLLATATTAVDPTVKIAARTALVRAVVAEYLKNASKLSIQAARGVKGVGSTLSVYGIFSVVLDLFDPYEYNRVLTKENVRSLNEKLDMGYFKRFRREDTELTPRYLVERFPFPGEDPKEGSERWEFYATRVTDYIRALRADATRPETLPPVASAGNLLRSRDRRYLWRRTAALRGIGIVVLLLASFLFEEYVQFWALATFVFLAAAFRP